MACDLGGSDSGREREAHDVTADHQIAALFVATGGCYFGLPGIDPWDKARDARLYAEGGRGPRLGRAAAWPRARAMTSQTVNGESDANISHEAEIP